MDIFSRFFGHRNEGDDAQLVANPELENPLSLQLLFEGQLRLHPDEVILALRSYHHSMGNAQCELDKDLGEEGKVFGLLGWGKHVVKMVGFDLPMPTDSVEACVGSAHYAQHFKDQARTHTGHILLYYAGYETSPYEQYVALAAIGAAFSKLGAILILNEAALTSFPTAALAGADPGEDIFELLRTLPLSILYCGFVKYEIEDVPGICMRSHGAYLLGLPDFGTYASGHEEGQRYFELFENIFAYLRDSNAELAPGHTMQVGEEDFLRCREPNQDEYYFESEGKLLVVDVIGPDEIEPGT